MRIPLTPEDAYSPAQQTMATAVSSGPRGAVSGPMLALLEHPAIGGPVQAVGAALRFGGVLPGRLRELSILVTARRASAQYEWHAHAPIALREGLSPAIVSAIQAGERPAAMADDERLVYDATLAMQQSYDLPDALLAEVQRTLGAQGLIELIALCGYYTLISQLLNVTGVEVPGGDRPLSPLR